MFDPCHIVYMRYILWRIPNFKTQWEVLSQHCLLGKWVDTGRADYQAEVSLRKPSLEISPVGVSVVWVV